MHPFAGLAAIGAAFALAQIREGLFFSEDTPSLEPFFVKTKDSAEWMAWKIVDSNDVCHGWIMGRGVNNFAYGCSDEPMQVTTHDGRKRSYPGRPDTRNPLSVQDGKPKRFMTVFETFDVIEKRLSN